MLESYPDIEVYKNVTMLDTEHGGMLTYSIGDAITDSEITGIISAMTLCYDAGEIVAALNGDFETWYYLKNFQHVL